MSRHKSSPRRVKEAYDEVALLEMEEAEYLELLRRAKPLAVHPTWQAYRAWMKDFIEKAAARGFTVQLQRGTLIGLDAFIFTSKMEYDTKAMCAYARHLFLAKMRNGG